MEHNFKIYSIDFPAEWRKINEDDGIKSQVQSVRVSYSLSFPSKPYQRRKRINHGAAKDVHARFGDVVVDEEEDDGEEGCGVGVRLQQEIALGL